ncbi:MAG: glycoside hydrolase [Tannerellaceae bacterium]|jgi:hypothetical protein|nr:glycoside hydrolase [Tannerellaceae bacterium]
MIAASVTLLCSCLGGSEDDYDVDIPKDCQIALFSLSHDSIPVLAETKFTIDQINGEIFNIDSLPCGTIVGKAACSIRTVNTYAVAAIHIVQETNADTLVLTSTTVSNAVTWTAADSVDLAQPVQIIVYGIDGVTRKTYLACLNIHRQEPEAMSWTVWADGPSDEADAEIATVILGDNFLTCFRNADGVVRWQRIPITDKNGRIGGETIGLEGINGVDIRQLAAHEGRLYLPSDEGLLSSVDGETWEKVLGGEAWLYILGSIKGGSQQDAVLAGIARIDGEERFVHLDTDGFGTGAIVPDDFPQRGAARTTFIAMHRNYLLLAGGRTVADELTAHCWSSPDGETWVRLTGEHNPDGFSPREGAALVEYDGYLWLFGGRTDAGDCDNTLFRSRDRGITWQTAPAVVALPAHFTPTPFANVFPDGNGALLLFSATYIRRGGINRLLW